MKGGIITPGAVAGCPLLPICEKIIYEILFTNDQK